MLGLKRATASLTCVVTALLGLVLLAGPAAAEPPVATPVGDSEPITLAATGLNIVVPLIVGSTLLVIGLALIAWMMLRRGDRTHS